MLAGNRSGSTMTRTMGGRPPEQTAHHHRHPDLGGARRLSRTASAPMMTGGAVLRARRTTRGTAPC